MNFDWYGATVDVRADEAHGEALRAFDMASWYDSKPHNGFGRALQLRRGDTVLGSLQWENRGAPSEASCYLEASGRQAAPWATWLRSWQPDHRVARADVAEDYSGAGTWPLLSKITLAVADRHRVDVDFAGDHHRGIRGRTIYVGGRSSAVRLCLYEKGLQLDDDPNWVRSELRIRPANRKAKYSAARLAPASFFGCSRWSENLSTCLAQPDVARLSLGTVYRDADVQRARNALISQYGNVIRQWKGELGGWTALAQELAARLPDES